MGSMNDARATAKRRRRALAERPRPKKSWLGRWLARVAERLARRYYEGPEPPPRLALQVQSFMVLHPRATSLEWARFAVGHGDECYRSGFVRGLERSVRDLAVRSVGGPPLIEERHEASWVDLAPSEDEVQQAVDEQRAAVERMSPEDRLLYQDMIGQQMGGFRVALLPTEPRKKVAR